MKRKIIYLVVLSLFTANFLTAKISADQIKNQMDDIRSKQIDNGYQNYLESSIVNNIEDLEKALMNRADYITINNDIVVDRALFVDYVVNIVINKDIKISRANDYGGDIFVVGENKEGVSAIINKRKAKLSFIVDDGKTLTFDGNKNSLMTSVKGSLFFISYSGEVDLCKGIKITGFYKTGNERANNEKYMLSYTDNIGGSVALVANGLLEIDGAEISNNSVNELDEIASSRGGAIYNYSNVVIYSGLFNQNNAARGGFIYNYREAKIYGGTFDNNYASEYGGFVYNANSEYTETIIGKDIDDTNKNIIISNNHAKKTGGAIFNQNKNVVVILGDALFDSNYSEESNGGAIYNSGTLISKNATFKNNHAYSKGGALYIVNNTDDLTTRYSLIDNTIFEDNYASRGGALGVSSSDENLKEGGKVFVTNSVFNNNKSQQIDNETNDAGGAIYLSFKGELDIKDTMFDNNSANREGGALYASRESKLNIDSSTFTNNKVTSSEEGNGGVLSLHSVIANISNSTFSNNTSERHGGVIYSSYSSESDVNTNLHVEKSIFNNNSSNYHGGVLYSTKQETTINEKPDTFIDCEFTENSASHNGGAIYLTKSNYYIFDSSFNKNHASAEANSEGSRYGGGAIYITDSNLELDNIILQDNSSDYNGGAIALYSNGKIMSNELSLKNNSATSYGGAVYINKSTFTAYSSDFEANESSKGGGAVASYTGASANIYNSRIANNKSYANGGALYVYSGADSSNIIQDSIFESNVAEASKAYGGAIYVSNASVLNLFNNKAYENEAVNGGFMYETTTDTVSTINGLEVNNNKAKSGNIIYGNTNKAKLNINKNNYIDLQVENLDSAYWSSAIANKITVNEINDPVPSYEEYESKRTENSSSDDNRTEKPTSEIFNLMSNTNQGDINDEYASLPKLDNSSNFMSKETTVFDNINGKTVTTDTFVYHRNEKDNNPSFGEGILILQAMQYKKKYPSSDVSIDISSFRFSTEASICIDRDSRYFGYMRNLVGQEYDEYGFVRIAYLLVSAAKMGINVNVIGQMDAYPINKTDKNLIDYFAYYLEEPCDSNYVGNKKVKDYMNFNFCYWTSYEDNAATDMMHTKLCAVSNYTDFNDNDHGGTIWLSSTNLDGINANGTNGNNKMQTGIIISDHDDLYRISHNYLRILSNYCGQEDVYLFRHLCNQMNTDQIDKLRNGQTINEDEQIVYIGSDSDKVFELYFSPYGGPYITWDEYNPICLQLENLYNSDDYVELAWINVKNVSHTVSKLWFDVVKNKFNNDKNENNKLYLRLPEIDKADYSSLTVGKDIGYLAINKNTWGSVHNKDIIMSYSQNGNRKYVSILNSMNIHQGSMDYQSNYTLLIKEDEAYEGSVYYTLAKYTADGIAKERDILVDSIIVSENDIIAKLEDATYTLSVEVTPENAKNKELQFASSDESIATVDNNGVITFKSSGEVTITISSTDGSDKKEYVNIKIVEAEPDIVVVEKCHINGGPLNLKWENVDNKSYWCEKGIRQAEPGDKKNIWDKQFGRERGREIYDPESDAWYWLDSVYNGAKATNKEVWIPYIFQAEEPGSTDGKWVRYDENGKMIKGWYENENGKYYYDLESGAMAKGNCEIDGKNYFFDPITGVLSVENINGWKEENGKDYWYENGVKQGLEGRGKEIYDPESDAWYWLDAIQGGAKTISKDVYQESDAGEWAENPDGTGKWVRYDENGHMIKGWNSNENGTYYFDLVFGTMAKGNATIDNNQYYFDEITGILK